MLKTIGTHLPIGQFTAQGERFLRTVEKMLPEHRKEAVELAIDVVMISYVEGYRAALQSVQDHEAPNRAWLEAHRDIVYPDTELTMESPL